MIGNTRGMGAVPSPAVRGRGQLTLTVNTFGLPRNARYGQRDRNGRGARLAELNDLELFEALRASTHAARIACAEAAERDFKIALLQIQRCGVELVKRASRARLDIVEDPRDTPTHLLAVG
jgi:hypothetical protein